MDRKQWGDIPIWIEQEGGSGGKDSSLMTIRNLSGFDVHAECPTGDKASRWKPLAAQQQAGNVWIVRGDWDWADYVQELDSVSGDRAMDKSRLCDCADASALAFNQLVLMDDFVLRGELIASGGPEDDQRRMTPEEVDQLPPFLRDLVRSSDQLSGEAHREDGRNWRSRIFYDM
jgi:hypothetical protein